MRKAPGRCVHVSVVVVDIDVDGGFQVSNIGLQCLLSIFDCLMSVLQYPVSLFHCPRLVFHRLMSVFYFPISIFHSPMLVFNCLLLVFHLNV